MKLVKIIAVVFSLMLVNAAFAKDLKVGVIDLMRIVEQSKSAQAMIKKIDNEFQPKEAEIVSKKSKLQEKVNELQKNQAVMTEANIEKLQKEITDIKRDLERKAEDFQRDYQSRQVKMQKKIMSDVQAAVDKVGKEGKYDIIIQKPMTIYMNKDNKDLDITERVIKSIK